MCGGVLYLLDGRTVRTYFPNPKAQLPVVRRGGASMAVPWGRRKQQPGRLPLGGWARLDSIHSGRWDRWFPRPVKIRVLAFMEKDIEGSSHWFDLVEGQWIQGLLAHDGDQQRIYVVTIKPEMEGAVHDRWPRILSA